MPEEEYRSDTIYATGDIDWLTGRAVWGYDYFTVPDEKDTATKVFYESLEDAKNKTGFEKVVYFDE